MSYNLPIVVNHLLVNDYIGEHLEVIKEALNIIISFTIGRKQTDTV